MGSNIFTFHTDNEELKNMAQTDVLEYLKREEKKLSSKAIANRFKSFDPKRAHKVLNCGNYLQFNRYNDGSKKLDRAFFCKDPLCRICQSRRSILEAKELQKYHEEIKAMGKTVFHVMLSLRGNGHNLEYQRSRIWDCWKKFRSRKQWKNIIDGFYASLEMKHSEDLGWLTHLHIYTVFDKSVPQEMSEFEWLDMRQKISETWQDITTDSYIVGLSAVKNVYQFTKYITKPGELEMLSEEAFKEMAETMKGKRLRTTGGLLKELKLEFSEREYLAAEDEEATEEVENLEVVSIETWKWNGRAYDIVVQEAVKDYTQRKKYHTPGGL